jgi:hypothetical protein
LTSMIYTDFSTLDFIVIYVCFLNYLANKKKYAFSYISHAGMRLYKWCLLMREQF